MLSYLGYSGRHHNFSPFILSQKLNSISTGTRDDATRIIFFKTHNKHSLKILRDKLFGYIEDDNAERKLLNKVNKNRYIDIKLKNRPPSYNIH